MAVGRRHSGNGRPDAVPFCVLVCITITKPSQPARRPCAGAWPGPVGDLLGGETSPAASSFQQPGATCSAGLLADLYSDDGATHPAATNRPAGAGMIGTGGAWPL